MNKIKSLFWFGLLTMGLNSCKLFYPNQMFKQKDYQYFEFAQKQLDEYLIEPGDQLTIRVYSRDGFKLVDVLGGGLSGGDNLGSQSSGGASSNIANRDVINNSNTTAATNNPLNVVTYLVDREGYAKIPIIGDYYVKGYSHHQLEKELAQKYSALFVDPYVVIKVTNRRVFVFTGSTGSVVGLNEAPTSLVEVLAKAGGLDRNLKAYNIKIIRGDLKNPEVRIVDLSTLEGLRQAELEMRPNDIVYVQERKRIVRDILTETMPVFSAITAIVSFVVLIKTLGK